MRRLELHQMTELWAPLARSRRRRCGRAVAVLALGLGILLAGAEQAHAATITVSTPAGFQAAVRRLAGSGGTIVLRPGIYEQLSVGWRSSRPLVISGSGATVRHLTLDHTQAVTLRGLTIAATASVPADASITYSQHVTVTGMRVIGTTIQGAILTVDHSHAVTITASQFTACGDYQGSNLLDGRFGLCLGLRYVQYVTVSHSWFHDCRGCDFLHTWDAQHVLITMNTFKRALVGPCGLHPDHCNHNDLLQLAYGTDLRIVSNTFGVTQGGAAQLYITNRVDGVLISNNVFQATDPLVPGLVEPDAIKLGNEVGWNGDQPLYAVVRENTILAGGPGRLDGVQNSIILSTPMRNLPEEQRPLIVNNVIGVTRTPSRLCGLGTLRNNVLISGVRCSANDVLGNPRVDQYGHPTVGSILLINRALVQWATIYDRVGVRRDAKPDIGAFEFVHGSPPRL